MATFHFGELFDCAKFRQIVFNAFQHFHSQFLVGHFSATVAQGYFCLVPVFQEARYVAQFYLVIALFRAGAKFHFFYVLLLLFFLGSGFLFLDVEEVFTIIHDFADYRLCFGGYFDKVETCRLSRFEGFFYGYDAYLFTVCANEADFFCLDLVVYYCLFAAPFAAIIGIDGLRLLN